MANTARKLPRQPIPPLAHTLDAAMRSVSPMLNGLQRLKSKVVFELFGAVQASRQKRLLSLARERPINWAAAGLTHLWLSSRGGLPFANNYALLLEDDPQAATLSQRAARLIVAALKLYQATLQQTLSPDVSSNLPLEMDQYLRCFATHRRPRAHCDELVSITGSRHIAVMLNGQVHCLAVNLQKGGMSVAAVQAMLDHLIEHGHSVVHDEDLAPGMLTALPREQWAQQRDELIKDRLNQQTIMVLEKALFVVCLDIGIAPGSLGGFTANLRDGNAHNRYYDKSLQIVVMEQGKAGLCLERAAVDGSVALGFAERLHKESMSLDADQASSDPAPEIRIRATPWTVTLPLKRQLQLAKKTISARRSQRSVETWTMTGLGLNTYKLLKISADAVVQLAVQLAVHQVTGETPAIFEPVQLRHFAGGRMDFIVPVTAESLTAVQTLRDPHANQYFASVQVRRAAKEHQDLVIRTKNGRGLIGHLLALNAIQDKGTSYQSASSWQQSVLARLDKGLQALFRQDVVAANGSGAKGVASFSPIGSRSDMVSIGYMIKEEGITLDIRGDGRFAAQTRDLRAALDAAITTITRVLATSKAATRS